VTYAAALDWLYSSQKFGIKLGLDNIRRLLGELGRPEAGLKFLHVAGTNGKGSTCAMLDAALRAQGYRTGLYTSPHLVGFRERIRVDGRMIPEIDTAIGLDAIRGLSASWEHSPTYFEITTALAVWHFARAKCDYVVLETGMGGRLDSTNAVLPVVSILTPIAMDHTQWLGDTIEKIAAEKAGILKPGVPAVSAPQSPEARQVLERTAASVSAPLRFVEEPWPRAIGLAGRHQKWNAALAAAALEAAGISVTEENLAAGLRDVVWPGRFQAVGERIILDGAHNPHAAVQLAQTWRDAFGNDKALVIFGALRDKHYAEILEILAPIAERFLFVPVESERAEDPKEIAKSRPEGEACDSLAAALRQAEAHRGRVLVTGSLFLLGEAMELLGALPA
jgi:dihydrofolate synthase / folylpolyglutamate synthase